MLIRTGADNRNKYAMGLSVHMRKDKKIKLQAIFMVLIMVAVAFVVAASYIAQNL